MHVFFFQSSERPSFESARAVRNGDELVGGHRPDEIQHPFGAVGFSIASPSSSSSNSSSSSSSSSSEQHMPRTAASAASDSHCSASPGSASHHGALQDGNEPAQKRARVDAPSNADVSSSARSLSSLADGNSDKDALADEELLGGVDAVQDGVADPNVPPRALTGAEAMELGQKVCCYH